MAERDGYGGLPEGVVPAAPRRYLPASEFPTEPMPRIEPSPAGPPARRSGRPAVTRRHAVLIGGVALLTGAVAAALVLTAPAHPSGRSAATVAGGVRTLPTVPSVAPASPTPTPTPSPTATGPDLPDERSLPDFVGRPTRAGFRAFDRVTGVSFACPGYPWMIRSDRAKVVPGFTHEVRIRAEGRLPAARVLTGPLPRRLARSGEVGSAELTAAAVRDVQRRLFPDGRVTAHLASQPVRVAAGRGWLIAYRTTLAPERGGAVVVVAVVPTRRAGPALLTMFVPEVRQRRLADINLVVDTLRTA